MLKRWQTTAANNLHVRLKIKKSEQDQSPVKKKYINYKENKKIVNNYQVTQFHTNKKNGLPSLLLQL